MLEYGAGGRLQHCAVRLEYNNADGKAEVLQVKGWMEYNNADGKAEVLYR